MHTDHCQRPYRRLGAVSSFPDELIAWTVDQQIELDWLKRPDYVQCLKEIAELRRSEDLQTKAAIAESLGSDTQSQQFSITTYQEALAFINAQDNTTDEFIWTLMTAKVRRLLSMNNQTSRLLLRNAKSTLKCLFRVCQS